MAAAKMGSFRRDFPIPGHCDPMPVKMNQTGRLLLGQNCKNMVSNVILWFSLKSMGNREPSNQGHFSEQLTTANKKCTLQLPSQKLNRLILNTEWQSIRTTTHHTIWGMKKFNFAICRNTTEMLGFMLFCFNAPSNVHHLLI
jgi:hypothetical protein